MISQIRRKTPKKWKKLKNPCRPNQFKNYRRLAKNTPTMLTRRNSNTSKKRTILKIRQLVGMGQELTPVMMHLCHSLITNQIRTVTLLQKRLIILSSLLPSITRLLQKLLWFKRMRRITKIKLVKKMWVRLLTIQLRLCPKTWVRKISLQKPMEPRNLLLQWKMSPNNRILQIILLPFLRKTSLRLLFHQYKTQTSLQNRIHLVIFLGSRGLWIRWNH